MNCFDLLEIPYHSDKNTIKKAYSKLVKIYSPEKNPIEYQKLREAYDEALKLTAKATKSPYSDNLETKTKENPAINFNKLNNDNFHLNIYETFDNYKKTEVTNIKDPLFEISELVENSESLFKEELLRYLELASDIENSKSLRNNFSLWEKLLKDPLLWNMEVSLEISKLIFTLFARCTDIKYCFLILANKHFRWDLKKEWLYNFFNKTKVNSLIDIIKYLPNLSYETLSHLSNEELKDYISLKKHSFSKKESLSNSNIKALKVYYEKFFNDYQLNYLIGKAYYNIGNYKESLKYLKSSLDSKNDYEYSLITLGCSLYFLGEKKLAKEKILSSFEVNNRSLESLHSLAFLEYEEGNFLKAEAYLTQIKKSNENFFENLSKNLFKNMNKKKKRKAYKELIDPYKSFQDNSKIFGIDTVTFAKWFFTIGIFFAILRKLGII